MKRSLRTRFGWSSDPVQVIRRVKTSSRYISTLFILLALCASLLPASSAHAANGSFAWAKTMGGTLDEWNNHIEVDAAGNLYTTGAFEGTADFDPGPGIQNLTSAGDLDSFVVKLDSQGNFVWARGMGGVDYEEGSGLAVDTSGNVYILGGFAGTTDFDPGPSMANLTSAGSGDIFVAKLDSNGDFVWAKSLGGTLNDASTHIEVDPASNLHITGLFQGTADFDPGVDTYNRTSAGSYDIFISKLDRDGNLMWAQTIGGVNFEPIYSLALDASGNVYTTGSFQGTIDFDPGLGTANLTSAGERDIFVSKLDSIGNFVWVRGMGGTMSDEGRSLALDASGNVYTTGSFGSIADFDPGAGTANLTSAGLGDIFVSKLDSNGGFIWARGMGGVAFDRGNKLALDAGGNVYLTGHFGGTYGGTADLDPGPGTYILTSAGFGDIFVSKLDVNGDFAWAGSISGVEPAEVFGLALDVSSNLYVTGYFEGTSDFDPGPGTASLTTVGGEDIFITKLQEGDTFEPDNFPAVAKDISSGAPQTHSITPPTDVDWLKFTLSTSSAVTIETSGTAAADTEMSLYASSDLVNPLGYNNDKDAEGGNHYSYLAYNCNGNALPAGTYYVKVGEVGGDQEVAEYQIDLSVTACPAAASFGDVPLDYWAWSFVERLYTAGITGGCGTSPLRYCPEDTVTRAQMAVFLLRGIHTASYMPPAVEGSTGFGDVPTDYWAAAFIKQLAAEGVTSGCGGGNFCPEQSVTRAQMAVFLLKAKHGASYIPPEVGSGTGFGDVSPSYWAAAFIKQLVTEGITSGCGSGNYCPEQPVTRAQMAVFLVRTFSLP